MNGDVTRQIGKSSSANLWLPTVHSIAFLLGLAGLILEYGTVRIEPTTGLPLTAPPLHMEVIHALQYLAVAGFIFGLWSGFHLASDRKKFFRERGLEMVFAAGAGVLLGAVLGGVKSPSAALAIKLYLAIQMSIILAEFAFRAIRSAASPIRASLGGFLAAIAAGALLLALPCATYRERFSDTGNNLADHLFTATSALTLTGLNVLDIPTYYSPFGQIVILLLMQLGGLSMLILGVLYTCRLMGYPRDTKRRLQLTILWTLFIEIVGALILVGIWPNESPHQRFFKGLFHSVSALCNVGFTLQTNSLIPYAHIWQAVTIIPLLVILGGLGFPVLFDIVRAIRHRSPLCLHSQVVLISTAAILIVSTAVIFLIESPRSQNRWGRNVQYEDIVVTEDVNVMANHDQARRLIDAFFLSASSRGGGFTIVDTTSGKLHPVTQIVLATLMLIGGSPASAAGGIKTVTLMVLAAAVVSTLRQRSVRILGRPIDGIFIQRALAVCFLYMVFIWLLATILVLTHPQINVLDLVFESVSAGANGGLSTGITSMLNLTGRCVLMLAMLVGRLGPLALLFAITTGTEKPLNENALITG